MRLTLQQRPKSVYIVMTINHTRHTPEATTQQSHYVTLSSNKVTPKASLNIIIRYTHTHTHTHTHTPHTHTRTHACTHARTHAHTHRGFHIQNTYRCFPFSYPQCLALFCVSMSTILSVVSPFSISRTPTIVFRANVRSD